MGCHTIILTFSLPFYLSNHPSLNCQALCSSELTLEEKSVTDQRGQEPSQSSSVWSVPVHDRPGRGWRWLFLSLHSADKSTASQTDPCSQSPTGITARVERNNTNILWRNTACQSSYHARAVAVVAVLDLGARFVALTITALAGSIYVNGDFFVDSLCCLSECQLHDVLYEKDAAYSDYELDNIV